jgi:NTE family protein
VIKVLESHGIKAKIVTGTSAGSFVGSIYASGQTPYQMQNLALKLQESDLRDLTSIVRALLQGKNYRTTSMLRWAINQLNSFQNVLLRLPPVWIMVKRLNLLKEMQVRQYVHPVVSRTFLYPLLAIPNMSMAVWSVLFQSKRQKDMGADIVIAVDISARPTGDKPLSMWGLLDQTINIMGQQSINEELNQANVVIQPKVGHLGVLDLKSSNEAILEGERAAQAKIVAIQKAITDFKKSPAALQPAPRAKF